MEKKPIGYISLGLLIGLLVGFAVNYASSESICVAGDIEGKQCNTVTVGLSDVPETMLWTLHNRNKVAADPEKSWFVDETAMAIYQAIDYDYEASFGKAEPSHGIRSWIFDQAIMEFWKTHPDGTIVNFAEGLETQRFRLQEVRSENAFWVTVDLPPAIRAREKFIQPDLMNLHVTASVLDTEVWSKVVPKDKPVFFTAQGLLMYLEEDDIRGLFQMIARDYPSSTLWFDSIAKWLSQKTLSGWNLTKDYTTPPMPFGANKNVAEGVLKSWVPELEVEEIPWPNEKFDGFFIRYVVPLLLKIPYVRDLQPSMCYRVTFPLSSI